ncbi:hypothetical protein, partial [Aquipuribacter sp. SD81]|uniref:hypothetical protein n=1 Tax=Aquipuribacter sp. SD81 TaxID=3127703 RepID=UPI00301B4E22
MFESSGSPGPGGPTVTGVLRQVAALLRCDGNDSSDSTHAVDSDTEDVEVPGEASRPDALVDIGAVPDVGVLDDHALVEVVRLAGRVAAAVDGVGLAAVAELRSRMQAEHAATT